MNTKTMKILTMVATISLVLALGASTVFGVTITPESINGTGVTTDTSTITTLGNKLVNILQTVGVVLSVVILIILGIKYMMGSAEEKAEYKKTMMPYLIGAVFIFLAPTIANVIFKMIS